MKIQYCSDLHLEFTENKNFLDKNSIQPMGEIFLLAADSIPFAFLNEHDYFFDFVSDNFETVYWLPGNHEYSHYDLKHVKNPLYEKKRHNVFLVNNQIIPYKNISLIFSTMWTSIFPQNELEMLRNISDYSLIKRQGKHITPSDINSLNQIDFNFLTNDLSTNRDKTNVVVTHHVPTLFNYPEKFKTSNINQTFAPELYDFILSTNPAYWIYGHHHHTTPEFKIGKSVLLTNQLGYVRQNEHEEFKNNSVITIK